MLQPAHVRCRPPDASAGARRGARRGQVEARFMGRRAVRHRRSRRRRHHQRRSGCDRLGSRHGQYRWRRIDGALSREPPARHTHARRQRRSWRPSPGRADHARQDHVLRFDGRHVPFGSRADLGRQPGLYPDPQRALHQRGPLQRREDRHHRTGLQRFGRPCGSLDRREFRQRRRAGPVDGADHHHREARTHRLHPGADRPAAAGPYRQPALPAPERSRSGRPRRRLPRVGRVDTEHPAGVDEIAGAGEPGSGAGGTVSGQAPRRRAGHRDAGFCAPSQGPRRALATRADRGDHGRRATDRAPPRAHDCRCACGTLRDPVDLLQVLPRHGDGTLPDPRADAVRPDRPQGQRYHRLSGARDRRAAVDHRRPRQPAACARRACGRSGQRAGLHQGQDGGPEQRGDPLRHRAGEISRRRLRRRQPLLLPRRPAGALRQLRPLRHDHEARVVELSRRSLPRGLADPAAGSAATHLLRDRRQHPAPRARLQRARGHPGQGTRPAGHGGLAHEQYRAAQRLCAACGRLVREGRHPVGDAARALRARHQPRGRTARRGQAGLLGDLPAAEGDPGPRARARHHAFHRPQRCGTAARQRLRCVHLRRPVHRGQARGNPGARARADHQPERHRLAAPQGEGLRALHRARHAFHQHRQRDRHQARRDDHRQHLAHGEEVPVADADPAHPVLHRSPFLPGAGGGAADAQGQPADRRELPADAERRAYALVDPRRVA